MITGSRLYSRSRKLANKERTPAEDKELKEIRLALLDQHLKNCREWHKEQRLRGII